MAERVLPQKIAIYDRIVLISSSSFLFQTQEFKNLTSDTKAFT